MFSRLFILLHDFAPSYDALEYDTAASGQATITPADMYFFFLSHGFSI